MTKKRRTQSEAGGAALTITAFGEIPLVEVSGLALAQWEAGTFLVAVGDHGPDVAFVALPSLPSAAGSLDTWRVIDLSTVDAPDGTPAIEQAEAIAVDGVRSAAVLIEDPPLLLVLDVPDRRVTRTFSLDGADLAGLGSTWAHDASSRGEGMVLLRDGHVLVVKEKRPAGFIEFGPEGDSARGVSASTVHPATEEWVAPPGQTLVALAWWPADDQLDDLSDAAVGPDGCVYLLSDKSNAIGRLALPLDPASGEPAALDKVWALPDEVVKAEGLAFLPGGGAVVAVDRPRLGRNLVVLPPTTDWA